MEKVKQTLMFQGGVEGVRPLRDGSVSITFHSQEMKDEDKLVLLNLLGKFGWCLFKEDERPFDFSDAPKENTTYQERKTPAQRLRNVLFVYWEKHRKQDFPDFEVYYERQIETLIQQYKNRIE